MMAEVRSIGGTTRFIEIFLCVRGSSLAWFVPGYDSLSCTI